MVPILTITARTLHLLIPERQVELRTAVPLG
jgi:hypothetical protein